MSRKNNKKKSKVFIIAASIAAILIAGNIGTYMTYGDGLFTVIKEVSTGNITMYEEKQNVDIQEKELPQELKGKIFDEKGNPVEKFEKSKEGSYYSEDGRKLVGINYDEKTKKYSPQFEGDEDNYLVRFDSLADAKKKLKIDPLIIPNLKIKEIRLYKEDSGKISPEFIDILYTADNGDEIFTQQRLASKQNGYVSGGSKVEEVKINGNKAILTSGDSLDWQQDNKLIGVHSRKKLYTGKDLIKLCETMEYQK